MRKVEETTDTDYFRGPSPALQTRGEVCKGLDARSRVELDEVDRLALDRAVQLTLAEDDQGRGVVAEPNRYDW